MSYEIPQELEYKEKIIFSLTFQQLAMLIPAALVLMLVLKSGINDFFKFFFGIIVIGIGVGLAFFNLKSWSKRAFYYYKNKELSVGDEKLKKFLEIKNIQNNILQTKESKISVIEVIPKNTGLLDDESTGSLLSGFQKLLNSLTSSIQILITSNELNQEEYTNQLENHCHQLLRDNTEELIDYFNRQITEEGTLNKRFFLVIKESQDLEVESNNFIQQLNSLGLQPKRLENDELLNLSRHNFKNYLVAKSENAIERFSPKKVSNYPDHLIIDGIYCRTIYATGYPRSVNLGFFNNILKMNKQLSISLFINPESLEETLLGLNRELQKQRADLYSLEKKGALNPSLNLKFDDTHNTLKSVQKGEEKVFKIGFYITIKSKTKEGLERTTKQVISELEGNLLQAKNSFFRQLQGINTNSPICKDELQETRTITTKPLSAFYPFTNKNFTYDEEGVWFGNTDQGIPIITDIFKLANPNGLVLATSGAGKSYLTKLLIYRNALKGTKVLVVDPQNEYSELIKQLNGEVVTISKNSSTIINPLDLMGHDYPEKRLSLLSLLDVMLGDVTDIQKSALDRALTKTYEISGIGDNPKTWNNTPPILQDLVNELYKMSLKASVIEKPTYNSLLNRLNMFVTGSFKFLNQQTKLNYDKDIVCFNIGDMPRQVKPTIMFLILDYVYARMKQTKEKRLLVIDEAWSLLGRAEEASYIFEIVKTSRKFNLGLLLITQDAQDLVNSNTGQAVLSNTAYTILLRQKPSVINQISKTFNLSSKEKDYLISSNIGSGIIITENEHNILNVISSPKEHEIIETKIQETKNSEEVITNNKPTLDEIEKIGLVEKKLLDTSEVNHLLKAGFVISSHVPLGGGRRKEYLLKVENRDSPKHSFLLKSVANKIREFTSEVITYDSVNPDIVYKIGKKRIAVEIETGSSLKNIKKLKEKLSRLEKYDDWYFVVTSSPYAYKYKKFGQTFTRMNVMRRIRKDFQPKISRLKGLNPKNSANKDEKIAGEYNSPKLRMEETKNEKS